MPPEEKLPPGLASPFLRDRLPCLKGDSDPSGSSFHPRAAPFGPHVLLYLSTKPRGASDQVILPCGLPAGQAAQSAFLTSLRGWSSGSWLLGASPGSLGLGDLGSSLLGAGVPVEGVRQGEAGKSLEGVKTCVLWPVSHTNLLPPDRGPERGGITLGVMQQCQFTCPTCHSLGGSEGKTRENRGSSVQSQVN